MSIKFPPLLISFEGIDGSGKSTQAAMLDARLRQTGKDPLTVREPGGTQLSEAVRSLLLDASSSISDRAELLLFAAARAQLVDEVIKPALAAGRTVICDRFFDSTTAYQGGGRGLASVDWLDDFHRFTTGGLVPDRTYLVDVPLNVASARRGAASDRMEASGEAFFERVRKSYRRIASAEPERVVVLDGQRPAPELHKVIWTDLSLLATGTADWTSG